VKAAARALMKSASVWREGGSSSGGGLRGAIVQVREHQLLGKEYRN
jgi:hypothetical protein